MQDFLLLFYQQITGIIRPDQKLKISGSAAKTSVCKLLRLKFQGFKQQI